MRSVPVVVLDVLGQDRLQVPPTKDQQPVQALAADTGDPAFAPSIRIRRPHRRPDHLQAFGSKDGIEGGGEFAARSWIMAPLLALAARPYSGTAAAEPARSAR
jgi:hypothetical protein